MHPPPQDTLADVRGFLRSLRSELPELFPGRPRSVEEARALALADLSARTQRWAERMNLRPRRVRVGDARTRWGSCSADGSLRFNWRLLLAPEPVRDYVVVHELAHLVRLDHSKGFWRVVDFFLPDHKARRRWLRLNGRGLSLRGESPPYAA